MLNKIKIDLRISHSLLDVDIQDNIDSCIDDLKRVGINLKDKEKRPLIIKAVKLYCRWQYNFENQAERYKNTYENLRNSLSLNGEYNV